MTKPHIPHWAPGHHNLKHKGSAGHATRRAKPHRPASANTPGKAGGDRAKGYYLNPRHAL